MTKKTEDVQDRPAGADVVEMVPSGPGDVPGAVEQATGVANATWERLGDVNKAQLEAVSKAFEMMVNSGTAFQSEWSKLLESQYRECTAFAEAVTKARSVVEVAQLQSAMATRMMHETMTASLRIADVGRTAIQNAWKSADKNVKAITDAGAGSR
ncbi:MAG: phasin family protein [Rhodospirillales bacterium]|nr:MAG: phasin family protein [Rhodospirillales bacterium]